MPLPHPAAAVALALALALIAAPALAQTPTPPAGAAFRLGADRLTALRDGALTSPNDGGDFGSRAGPAAVAAVLAAAGAPTDRISLDVDALLLRMPGHTVLLDTGMGPPHHGALIASLALAGVAPGEITDVLITHGHFDHVGGLLTHAGAPAFPRARVWVSAREWAALRADRESRALVAAIAPQVTTFVPGRPILPGVTPIALYGHTPGHVGYQIVSRGRTLEDIGDIAHSSIVSLARPDWLGGIDDDPPAGARTRQAELARLAAHHTLIFAPHFPFPGVGWVVAKGQGYVWRPDGEVR